MMRNTGVAERTSALFRLDPSHTAVEFQVKHMMFTTVRGRFPEVSGELFLDAEDATRSWVKASVQVASVDTRDAQRDAHLRSADFFDAEQYPTITFESKRVELGRRENEARVVGDLTIRGVTKEVVFDAAFVGRGNDPWGNVRVGLTASTTVNRKDFGLTWNVALEAGGWLVGDEIKINLEIQGVYAG
jgi:polyisoprenoid-binding protein YceI